MKNLVFGFALLLAFAGLADNSGAFTYAHWNIGHFAIGNAPKSKIRPQDADRRLKAFKKWMNVGADWFGISEYAPDFTTDGSVKTATALFGDYAVQYAGPDHQFQWNAQFGKAGRFKSLEAKTVQYRNRFQKTYYIAQRVLIDGKTEAWIVQTHFDWKSCDFIAAQFKQLTDDFRNCPRVIISGDFNWQVDNFRNDELWWTDHFRKAGYDVALDDLSLAPGTGQSRSQSYPFIDNIAVKGFEISDVHVVFDAAREMSDHYIVHCRLTPTKDAHTHAPGPWQVTKDPTATSAGERVRTCTVPGCRHAERRKMAPLKYAWLETDGKTSFATDYIPDLERTAIEVTFRYLGLGKDGQALCWANGAADGHPDDQPAFGACLWPADGEKPVHFECGARPASFSVAEGFSDTAAFHTLIFCGDRAAFDGKKTKGTVKPPKGKAGGQLILFSRPFGNPETKNCYSKNHGRVQLKSFRIWETNGAKRKLVHHYVPAKDGATATLYDLVEKRYLRKLGGFELKLGE